MSDFKIFDFNELIKELDKYKFKQLHIYHTWKPTHRSFNGNNHIQLQESMKNYHIKENKWSDIGQHLTLFPDGNWVTGRSFEKAPSSISGWNKNALAVEMLGNFDKIGDLPFNDLGYDELEGKQKEEILKLIKYFIDKYGEDSIKFHREGKEVNKSCPGNTLNKSQLILEAKNIKNEKENKDDINKPSSWAKKEWDWATKEELLNGMRPREPLTREELAIVLYRLKGVK